MMCKELCTVQGAEHASRIQFTMGSRFAVAAGGSWIALVQYFLEDLLAQRVTWHGGLVGR